MTPWSTQPARLSPRHSPMAPCRDVLHPAQEAAIGCLDRPLQIIACAGSGKTQVISQRIARILAQDGVEPRNIVAFTFTDKAAAELKDRVLSIVESERGRVRVSRCGVTTCHVTSLGAVHASAATSWPYVALGHNKRFGSHHDSQPPCSVR
jgi:superfamily I DNA/RNA helicase